ncbi:MAG: hypothetical protein ABFS45_20730 [Pseudomonadota bacterium]
MLVQKKKAHHSTLSLNFVYYLFVVAATLKSRDGALADSVKSHHLIHGDAHTLRLSFQGIPEEYFHKSGPSYTTGDVPWHIVLNVVVPWKTSAPFR